MFSDRVNIQYSVDVEELPAEVLRLIEKASTHTGILHTVGMSDLTSLSQEQIMSVATLDRLDRIRRQLAAADYVLNDVMNIVSGYLEFKGRQLSEGAATNEQAPPMPELEGMPEPQELHANLLFKDLDGLQDKVNRLNDQKSD